jgi:hypothetical protein
MRGALPQLSLYALMVWTGTSFHVPFNYRYGVTTYTHTEGPFLKRMLENSVGVILSKEFLLFIQCLCLLQQ